MFMFTYAMHNRPHETHTVYAVDVAAHALMMNAMRMSGYIVEDGETTADVNPWERTSLDAIWFHFDKDDDVLAAVACEEESDELNFGLSLLLGKRLGVRRMVHRPYATAQEEW